MSKEERLWWNILVEAETLSSINAHNNGELCLRYQRIAGRARATLRDKFGINLDDLGAEASAQVLSMERDEILRERQELESITTFHRLKGILP